jgi:hypothetical protein
MNISSVSTAIKVGQFNLNNNGNKARLRVEWKNLGNDVLKDNAGRVYLLCVNGVIKKIGGSVSKGGIKSTMSFYESANCGRPSIRSFGIQQLIFEDLCLNRNVDIYMIRCKQIEAPVKGLFDYEYMNISAFKEMEEKCLRDYVSMENQYPDWNYQESGKPWEHHIQEAHAKQLANAIG